MHSWPETMCKGSSFQNPSLVPESWSFELRILTPTLLAIVYRGCSLTISAHARFINIPKFLINHDISALVQDPAWISSDEYDVEHNGEYSTPIFWHFVDTGRDSSEIQLAISRRAVTNYFYVHIASLAFKNKKAWAFENTVEIEMYSIIIFAH